MRATKTLPSIAVVLLLLFIACQFGCFARENTNKHNLFFSTFPSHVTDYLYTFNGEFEQWRVEQLLKLMELKGSVQTIDTVEYDEWMAMKKVAKIYKDKKDKDEPGLTEKTPIGEFGNMELGKFTALLEQFNESVETLETRLAKFKFEYPQFAHITLANVQQFRHSTESDVLALIVQCKQFMRRLMSEEGESSWLDIFSFMKHHKDMSVPLKIIYELSKVQSVQLDGLLIEEMYKMHLENSGRNVVGAKPGQNQLRRAVVEGAGPAGLYATFQMFLAGMSVLLVNDRPEEYRRRRVFYLDPKWMCQLRFLLGSQFDVLFDGKKHGTNHEGKEIGQLTCRDLEEFMMRRLKELAKFLATKTNDNTLLELRYETAFVGIVPPSSGKLNFYAILATPNRHGNSQAAEVNQAWIRERAAKIRACRGVPKDIARQELFEKILKKNLNALRQIHDRKSVGRKEKILDYQPRNAPKQMLSPEEWTNLEIDGKVLSLKAHKPTQLDLLVCAGGSNDSIRDKYLGKPKPRIIPRVNSVVIFEKVNEEDVFFEDKTVFVNDKTMADLVKFLKRRKMQEVFLECGVFLSNKFRKKYHNLYELMGGTLIPEAEKKRKQQVGERDVYHKDYKLNADGTFVLLEKPETQSIRVFENNDSILITAIPPPVLEEFLREFEIEKQEFKTKQPDSPDLAEFANLRKRLEWIWSAAVFDLAISTVDERNKKDHPNQNPKYREDQLNLSPQGTLVEEHKEKGMLNFNRDPVNTFIFYQTVLAVDDALKEIKNEYKPEHNVLAMEDVQASGKEPQDSVVVVAVGDANSSPHSFTASGLSTGRLGIERVAYSVRDYHLGKNLVHMQIDSQSQPAGMQIDSQPADTVIRNPHQREVKSYDQTVAEMRKWLNTVKDQVLNKARTFADWIPENVDAKMEEEASASRSGKESSETGDHIHQQAKRRRLG